MDVFILMNDEKMGYFPNRYDSTHSNAADVWGEAKYVHGFAENRL